ncbi:MAG TPA: LCP family protein [Candidatus Saccharimonadales bacterium]|nr:LCP family protein [Candidatus Saccharimonadales bacterium]
MKHRTNVTNTDGFVIRPRPSGAQPGRPTLDSGRLPDQFLIDPSKARKPDAPGDVSRSVISAENVKHNTLDLNLDLSDAPPKGGRHQKQRTKRKWPVRKIVKWTLIALLVLGLIVGGYFVYRFFTTGNKIFQGNIVNAVFAPPKELKMDANGRTNVIIFGTSEDDPGHDGADLTDSMMLASVDQKKKEAFLVSIPRDLYVEYNRVCHAYRGKINALYSCFSNGGQDEQAGQEALRKKVGEVFGLDVQYAVHLNYTALREAVDAVGGITVVIDSDHKDGILDRNFDWDCPKGLYTCYNVKYKNGPVYLNGKQALYLARARGANGETYGLGQANFDREGYQRKILVALLEKAASAGTLANPVAVNNLLTTLGNNVRTNFDAEEIKTLVKLGQEVKGENIASLVLNEGLVRTGNADGQSIVQPSKGLFSYGDLQAAVLAYATGDLASIEKATIDVLNSSPQAGVAKVKADQITAAKLIVDYIGDGPEALDTAPVQVFDLTKSKPGTRKKLGELFGVTVQDGAPAGVNSTSDFVVIVGTQPTQTAQ